MDIMKILDDVNPSLKAMKWIIVILCSVIVGLFSFDKLTSNNEKDKYSDKIKELEIQISTISNNQSGVQNNISVLGTKTDNNFNSLKNYVDSRIEFIIINQNNKNKEFLLSLLKLNNNVGFEKSLTEKNIIEVKSAPVPIKEVEQITIDTISKIEPIKVEKINVDSIVVLKSRKVGFFTKIKKVFLK